MMRLQELSEEMQTLAAEAGSNSRLQLRIQQLQQEYFRIRESLPSSAQQMLDQTGPSFWEFRSRLGPYVRASELDEIPEENEADADINLLWQLLGLRDLNNQVVLQEYNPYKARTSSPIYVFVDEGLVAQGTAEPFNIEEPITAGMKQVLFTLPGSLRRDDDSELDFTPLTVTGAMSETLALRPESISRFHLNLNSDIYGGARENELHAHLLGMLQQQRIGSRFTSKTPQVISALISGTAESDDSSDLNPGGNGPRRVGRRTSARTA